MANKTEKTENKMAIVKIPLERGKPNTDVYVALQGESYQIKRGIEVEVPAGVAEILRNSEEGLFKAYEYQKEKESE